MSLAQKIILHVFSVITILLVSFTHKTTASEPARYIWPIEIEGIISGNFAECRWNHFHAGLDIATYRKTGYKLFAIADGYVWRLKTSAVGYGKAVYLKLNDGRYVVYAHLERFNPQLQQYIVNQQKKTGSYETNLYPSADMFPVKAGDIIGYSGNSGDVAPHLHIELRNANEEPLNLLSHGLKPPNPDTTFAKIPHLAMQPLSPYSAVENQYEQLIFTTQRIAGHTYSIPEPIRVWGKIGLKVDAFDTDKAGQYRLAVHTVKLIVDGNELYTVALDHFSYEYDYHKNFFLYDRKLKYCVSSKLTGDYIRLFAIPHINLSVSETINKLTGYLFCGETLYAEQPHFLVPGPHSVTIEATDAQGNMSSLTCSLLVEPPPVFVQNNTTTDSYRISATPQLKLYDTFFSVIINTDKPLGADAIPLINLKSGGNDFSPAKILIHSNSNFEFAYVPDKKNQAQYYLTTGADKPVSQFQVHYISSDAGQFSSPDNRLEIKFESNNRPFIPQAEIIDIDSSTYHLEKLSPVYQLKPAGFQLSAPALIKITLPADSPKTTATAIFERMGGYWRLLKKVATDDTSVVVAQVDHLSTFTVFADCDPPQIQFVTPREPTDIMTPNSSIVCRVQDSGVGVSYTTIRMTINGKKVPAEYIYDNNTFIYLLGDTCADGKNVAEVFAQDRLGNATSKRQVFEGTKYRD